MHGIVASQKCGILIYIFKMRPTPAQFIQGEFYRQAIYNSFWKYCEDASQAFSRQESLLNWEPKSKEPAKMQMQARLKLFMKAYKYSMYCDADVMLFFEHGEVAKYRLSLLMKGSHPHCKIWYALHFIVDRLGLTTQGASPSCSHEEDPKGYW